MTVKRNQSGQAFVLTVLMITALLGLTALVVDVGSWFRAHRALQATADAAALAGAQELPQAPGSAQSIANDYAAKNQTGLAGVSVNLSETYVPNDTIRVHVEKPAEGIFSKVFGINSVDEGASATARTAGMKSALYVAPIVVNQQHPMLNNCGGPCFGSSYQTTIPVGKTGAPGAFGLVNLDPQSGGTSGASTLADWIRNGFDKYLDIGGYASDPGVKFNSNQIQDAMNDRIASGENEMLFPVYDTLTGQGANAEYHIIGWVGFFITGVDKQGNNGNVSGYFTRVIWTGIQASSAGAGGPNLGARAVQLVD
jgi:putative Flp pilus-assembly TadE/G-like protein